MQKYIVITGAVLALLAVAIGAFGAHGLAAVLAANGRADTFDTASQYHLMHALALFIPALLPAHYSGRLLRLAALSFAAGIVLFSGSLYALAVFNLGVMAAIAPLGGAAFIGGWGCIAWAAWQQR